MSPFCLDRFKPPFHSERLVIVALILATVVSVGCNGISSAVSPSSALSPTAHTELSISPSNLVLTSGAMQQFTATVSNTSNSAVTWSASSGRIADDGLFIAPSVAADTRVVISATSAGETTRKAFSTVTIQPHRPLHITTKEMPAGVVGTSYSFTLAATGGLPPYRWSLQGSWLRGLVVDAASGTVSGIPSKAGNFPVQAVVTDANSKSASQPLSLSMTPVYSASATYDGPAELPRVFIQSTLADTPAPGSKISLSAQGDLQAALDNAKCGDTIELQAGATYTGTFTLPAKNCDDANWIILRTSAPNSALPKEGNRITPCYAGVSSLPGRPALNCADTRHVMARIAGGARANRIISTAPGANYYRMIGLEIADTGANGNLGGFYDLVLLTKIGRAHV